MKPTYYISEYEIRAGNRNHHRLESVPWRVTFYQHNQTPVKKYTPHQNNAQVPNFGSMQFAQEQVYGQSNTSLLCKLHSSKCQWLA